jgi:hypothetical protein
MSNLLTSSPKGSVNSMETYSIPKKPKVMRTIIATGTATPPPKEK